MKKNLIFALLLIVYGGGGGYWLKNTNPSICVRITRRLKTLPKEPPRTDGRFAAAITFKKEAKINPNTFFKDYAPIVCASLHLHLLTLSNFPAS